MEAGGSRSVRVTVVIPMFNAEATIAACLSSVAAQTHRDLEVLLIDDASRDDTLRVAFETIADDDRFVVLRQERNQGASAARNLGIAKGGGRYLFFLDADDWLDADAIARMVAFAEENDCDLVCASHVQERGEWANPKEDGAPERDWVYSRDELLEYVKKYLFVSYKYTMLVHCWNKLFRFDVIRENRIGFLEELSQLEDVNFNFRFLRHGHQVGYARVHSYHHRIAQHSMSTKTGSEPDMVRKVVLAFRPIEDFLRNRDSENIVCPDKEISRLIITTITIAIIRLCRTLAKNPSLSTVKKIVEIANSPDLLGRMRYYSPIQGESTLIFLAIKSRLPILVVLAGLVRIFVLFLAGTRARDFGVAWRGAVRKAAAWACGRFGIRFSRG